MSKMLHINEIKLLKEFLGNFHKEIYGREISKSSKISQKNVSLLLNSLEKKGILKSRKKGKIKFFSLNKENSLLSKYLVMTEIYNSLIFLESKPKIKEITSGLREKMVGIFGSYAKGNFNKDSDLDIFVIGKIDEKKLKKKGETYGLEINIHSFKKEKFLDMLKNKIPLSIEIIKNHILLSNYEEFVEEVMEIEKN